MELNKDILSHVYQFLYPREILSFFETCPVFYEQEIRNKAFVENKDDEVMKIVRAGWKRMTVGECAEKVKKYLGYFIPFLYGRCNLRKWIEKMFTIRIMDKVVCDVFFADESLISEYGIFLRQVLLAGIHEDYTLCDLINIHHNLDKVQVPEEIGNFTKFMSFYRKVFEKTCKLCDTNKWCNGKTTCGFVIFSNRDAYSEFLRHEQSLANEIDRLEEKCNDINLEFFTPFDYNPAIFINERLYDKISNQKYF